MSGVTTKAPEGPLVTVIMPVFNAGGYLRAAVESVLAQTYQNWELILVDDGSTDDCMARLDDIHDPRVRHVSQANAGKPSAMNRGLALARGEFYALQDADDRSHPLRLERQLACLLADPSLAGVFCGHEVILNGKSLAPTFRPRSIEDCARDIERGWMPAHDPTGMYRLSLVGDIRYVEDLPIVEGHDYILRVGERFPLTVLGECLYQYRIHQESVTKKDPSARIRLTAEVIDRMHERRGQPRRQKVMQPQRTKYFSWEADNNLVSHFTASVADQVLAGQRLGALRTGWASVQLNPLSWYYTRPLRYALLPRPLMGLYRSFKERKQKAYKRPGSSPRPTDDSSTECGSARVKDHLSDVDLSVIIINWNSVGFLDKCLASVYSNTRGMSLEIVVVDNASYDGCAELITSKFPTVRFIQSEQNLGFAKGNNLAVEHSRGRNVLFLNSDTEVIGPAIPRLLACLRSVPDAGCVGPKLLNSDGSIQETCLQAFPTILNQLLDSAYLRARFPDWSLWGNAALFKEAVGPVPVDGIVGACLMIPRRIFERAGRFHPGYFMYAEDMDLCFRVQKLGLKNYYLGTATVTHHGGRSADSQTDKQLSAVQMRESLQSFMRIHRGRVYAALFQLTTGLAALCRVSGLTVAMLLPAAAEQKRGRSLALAKWRRVFKWALGREPSVKQPSLTPSAW
jgi:GT2 family glycosyltransferase